MTQNLRQIEPTPAQVADTKKFATDYLSGKYPNMDLAPTRVIHDLLVEPGAELLSLAEANMEAARKSGSLLEISKDPTGATPEIVDRVLSNWGVERQGGDLSRGSITLVLSTASSVVIPANTTFTGAGATFKTERTFVSTTVNPSNSSERRMVSRTDGSFAFVIDVVSDVEGSAGNIPRNTAIAWSAAPSNFITAFATSDFTGGYSTETNAELMARQKLGISAKTMGGRANIQAMLMETYPDIEDMAIIGHGDAEMRRDSHNLFGFKVGGKVDLYLRTSSEPIVVRSVLSCVLLNADSKLFMASIGRDEYPGFYDVVGVYPEDESNYLTGLEVVAVQRGYDLSPDLVRIPDITTQDEASFTRYQTASVQFFSPYTDVSGLTEHVSTVPFSFDIRGVPLIDVIQTHVAGRGIRNPAGDYLVKAATPLLVSVALDINKPSGAEDVDTAAVIYNVVQAINSIPLGYGELPAARIIDAAQRTLPNLTTVRSPISMTGQLLLPDGTTRILQDRHTLTVPTDVEQGLSPRTVAFYTSGASVSVNVRNMATLV
jgi:hypothetical protein